MKKLFKKIKNTAQKIITIQIRIILFLVYFILITPFGICVKFFRDYLAIKSGPSWQNSKCVKDISNFLKEQ